MIFTGPHDYFNRDYVREWTESANSKRPFRARFIDQFAQELSCLSHPKILDLGAGPGFLAERLLSECPIEVAWDGDDAGPFLTIDGHQSALTEAGFEEVCLVLTAGDLAMLGARQHQTTL